MGYHDLDGRPAFKLAMQEVGGRFYLYTGHLWHRGWSVLDVTDPGAPRLVRFIEGPANTWTIQVQVAAGRMITALERIAPGWGGDADAPGEEGVLIWDVSDPEDPRRLGRFTTDGGGTHRNYYDGGRYLHLAAGVAGYVGNIYVIVDIDDPSAPTEVGRWWVPGQWREGGETGAPPATSLHGGPYVEGDRAYLPYGGAGLVILDIADVTNPRSGVSRIPEERPGFPGAQRALGDMGAISGPPCRLVSRLSFSPPFQSFIAVHTVVPLPARRLVSVNSEAIKEDCDEPLGFAGLVDVRDERAPRLASLFPLPAPPPDAPFANFCERGGRFGPHNQHQPQHQSVLLDRDDVVYLTYFNAGLRVVDIADPRQPREVGWFVPPDPLVRRGTLPTKLVAQSEDVLVDRRGYIYLTDKNHGLYVLAFDGP